MATGGPARGEAIDILPSFSLSYTSAICAELDLFDAPQPPLAMDTRKVVLITGCSEGGIGWAVSMRSSSQAPPRETACCDLKR